MSKFKVGDRVRRTKDFSPFCGLPLIPKGTIGTIIDATDCQYPIVKFDGYRPINSDVKYLEPVPFSKADMKPGYVVEMRDGRKALILPYRDVRRDKDALILAYDSPNSCSWDPVDDVVADDLSWVGFGSRQHDIIRVYGLSIVGGCAIAASSTEHRDLLWERKETKKMTVAEVCKALGYDVEIVKDGATDA